VSGGARLRTGADGRARCWWCGDDPTYVAYHDDEWGRPLHDERALYELLCLEGFQAGLAWITVLRKRPALRVAFEGFVVERVATFGPDDVARVLADPGVIRHRGKVEAAVVNARAVLALAESGSSLSALVWAYAPPPRSAWLGDDDELPATSVEGTALAKELRRLGFRFVGPTTAYAFMQSAGLVDDHVSGCWRASS